jgi:hypothetical protein
MAININQSFDCSQKELVTDIARIIYEKQGYTLPNDPDYLWRSIHPTEKKVLRAAEEIFELFFGDSPEYED